MHVHVPIAAHTRSTEPPDDLAASDGDECVLCFAFTMYRRFGCDGSLRWVRRWRDARCPRATGLERRMETGGGYCDCEVFLNAWDLLPGLMAGDSAGDLDWPPVMPACAGIGPRSSQPCELWVPRRRW